MKICRVDEGAALEQMADRIKKEPHSVYYVSDGVLKALRKRAYSFRGKLDNAGIEIIAQTGTKEWYDMLLHKLYDSEVGSYMYYVMSFERLIDAENEKLVRVDTASYERVFFVI